MSKKLYVGNLSYSVTEEELVTLFSGYGSVDTVKLITDRDTGKMKGFAFVEMMEENDAVSAVEGLNGREVSGRQIVVDVARPKAPRGGGGGPRGDRSGGGGYRSGGSRGRDGGGGGGGNRW